MQSLSWSSASLPPARHSPDLLGTSLSAPPNQSSPYTSPLLGLFDAGDHQHPHSNLMTTFLAIFFEKLGPTYPFLSSESIYEKFLHRRLSPLLANAIAASAARYVMPSALHSLVHLAWR